MAVITPVGKFDFDWSPKDPESKKEMVKTASTEEATEATPEASDKDLLYQR
jgi:hypothetical protein